MPSSLSQASGHRYSDVLTLVLGSNRKRRLTYIFVTQKLRQDPGDHASQCVAVNRCRLFRIHHHDVPSPRPGLGVSMPPSLINISSWLSFLSRLSGHSSSDIATGETLRGPSAALSVVQVLLTAGCLTAQLSYALRQSCAFGCPKFGYTLAYLRRTRGLLWEVLRLAVLHDLDNAV